MGRCGVLGVGASLVLAIAVVGADQIAKQRVLVAGRHHVVNHRGGLVALALPWAWTLWAVVTAVSLWVVADPAIGPLTVVSVGLVVGGGVGNLVDRSRRDGVVDFISVGRWPTFNLADVAIVVGVGLAIASLVAGV